MWDGYLQLRMYLGTADAEVYSLNYPALDIRVTGDTWHAVGGGPVNCHSGTAESLETLVLPKVSDVSADNSPPATAAARAPAPTSSVASPHAPGSPGPDADRRRDPRRSSVAVGLRVLRDPSATYSHPSVHGGDHPPS